MEMESTFDNIYEKLKHVASVQKDLAQTLIPFKQHNINTTMFKDFDTNE
jgi:hypothetical protein